MLQSSESGKYSANRTSPRVLNLRADISSNARVESYILFLLCGKLDAGFDYTKMMEDPPQHFLAVWGRLKLSPLT